MCILQKLGRHSVRVPFELSEHHQHVRLCRLPAAGARLHAGAANTGPDVGARFSQAIPSK